MVWTNLEAELGDGLAVNARLLGGSRRCQFNVLATKVGESLGTVVIWRLAYCSQKSKLQLSQSDGGSSRTS
jgi:hypothetical protein